MKFMERNWAESIDRNRAQAGLPPHETDSESSSEDKNQKRQRLDKRLQELEQQAEIGGGWTREDGEIAEKIRQEIAEIDSGIS
jgi:hypothetical protein